MTVARQAHACGTPARLDYRLLRWQGKMTSDVARTDAQIESLHGNCLQARRFAVDADPRLATHRSTHSE
jgi:hypothetical protein